MSASGPLWPCTVQADQLGNPAGQPTRRRDRLGAGDALAGGMLGKVPGGISDVVDGGVASKSSARHGVGAFCRLAALAAGSARRGFLAIRQMEDAVNRIAQDAFYRASYYYRGLSIVELEAICSGKILPGPAYSFVSLSADPVAAMRFAANLSNRPYITHVVLAIDAHMARKLGAIPAVYSIASDVVDLRSRSESISRTFQLRYAYELQAHFAHKWPHGSAAMAKSVITLLDPLSVASRLAREMSVPCVPYRDLVPVIARHA